MTDSAILHRQALLRREVAVSTVVNAVMSSLIFLLVFGQTPAERGAYAFDFLPQTFGMITLGGIVPAMIMLARVGKGTVTPGGPVPTRRTLALYVLGVAILATLLCGCGAALLMMAFAPPALPTMPALTGKALYGGMIGLITSWLLLRMALGLPLRRRAAIG